MTAKIAVDPLKVALTDNELKAMQGLRETDETETYRSFHGIAMNCDLHPSLIRRTVRAIARKGLAVYARGLWREDGTPGGAGYSLTAAGQQRLELIDQDNFK